MPAINDESRRYVLPADAPYLRNMANLWATDPDLARQIESMPDNELYAAESAKCGDFTIAIQGSDGAKRYLHSRHNPVDEAKRLVDATNTQGRFVFCVHGLGLGYHV